MLAMEGIGSFRCRGLPVAIVPPSIGHGSVRIESVETRTGDHIAQLSEGSHAGQPGTHAVRQRVEIRGARSRSAPVCRGATGMVGDDAAMEFDPNAAAQPGSGVFGLPHSAVEAAVVLVPLPFDVTTSYRAGAADGPEAIRAASAQVDLFDLQCGQPYRRGIHMIPPGDLRRESRDLRARALPVLEAGGADPADSEHRAILAEVDRAGESMRVASRGLVSELFGEGKIPGVVGGDHSVPLGAIEAAAAARPGLGVLHVDAHADLRVAYEGFRFSHASIMANVLDLVPDVERIVQVGIRDLCDAEHESIRGSAGRVVCHDEYAVRRRLADGVCWSRVCAEIVDGLPGDVWVSFDIDGLDPTLCPNTGTPVPGGLSFFEACSLLETVQRSGRRIVGFDLCEVAPGTEDAGRFGDSWDANVGARVLYKLCGFALLSQ